MPAGVPDWVARRAQTHTDHPAIITDEGATSYRDLEARVAAVAHRLRLDGVAASEPVALLAANGLDFAVFAHGIPRSGAALMPLNARLTAEELSWQLQDAQTRCLIADETHRGLAERAASLAGIEVTTLEDDRWRLDATASTEAPSHAPDDVHSVIYTSGTSGRPKGALLTYGNFEASAAGSVYNLGVDAADVWLACLPLFHVGGLSILLRSAIYGTTALIQPRFDEVAVNAALRGDPAGPPVTLLSVVPTMLTRMLDADALPYPPSVRAVLVGGGPVAPSLLEEAMRRGLPVLQTYGLTEATSQVTTLSAADALRKLGSAGQPLLQTSVRIEVDDRPAGVGELGEILVAGPTVSAGYLGRPDATAEVIRDGWLHTGDIGFLDAEGYLTVADRRDDLIVTGGENVYPAEVEAVLLACPGVAECAVVGLPDPTWGQVVAAVIVTEGGGLERAQIEADLAERLPGYKRPRRLELRSAPLPRTASGKLLRRIVREELSST